MEQKQSEPKLPPIGAAADPAFIPGLTVPSAQPGGEDGPAEAEAETPDKAAVTGPEAETGPDAEAKNGPGADAEAPDDSEAPATVPAAEAGKSAEEGPEGPEDAESPEGAESAEGGEHADEDVEFSASDRRGAVHVDREGVRFTLDDQAAEWSWEEIGAVEYGTSRFGRRLTVTVHTPEKRWYPTDVQAPDKATLQRWTTLLDTVLDAYFEE